MPLTKVSKIHRDLKKKTIKTKQKTNKNKNKNKKKKHFKCKQKKNIQEHTRHAQK